MRLCVKWVKKPGGSELPDIGRQPEGPAFEAGETPEEIWRRNGLSVGRVANVLPEQRARIGSGVDVPEPKGDATPKNVRRRNLVVRGVNRGKVAVSRKSKR
jgi:hypothetical protein